MADASVTVNVNVNLSADFSCAWCDRPYTPGPLCFACRVYHRAYWQKNNPQQWARCIVRTCKATSGAGCNGLCPSHWDRRKLSYEYLSKEEFEEISRNTPGAKWRRKKALRDLQKVESKWR